MEDLHLRFQFKNGKHDKSWAEHIESMSSECHRRYCIQTYMIREMYNSDCTEKEAEKKAIDHMNWIDSIGKT